MEAASVVDWEFMLPFCAILCVSPIFSKSANWLIFSSHFGFPLPL